MKIIILAGGFRSTISEDQEGIPKPMLEIGDKPLLWHIMKQYSHFGYNDFIVCGGYKINVIKDYFRDYYIYQSDITVDLVSNQVEIHKKKTEDWHVTVADTGAFATTGQRVGLAKKYIDEEMFIVTYGDCLSNIDINRLIDFARENDKLATMVVAQPVGRHAILSIDENNLLRDMKLEAGVKADAWANACTYVFRKEVFNYLNGNYELDKQLLPVLAEKEQIAVFKHDGFWCPVETKRDRTDLENSWNARIAPWKVWGE